MVDTRVLEALAVRREGSSPFPSTIYLGGNKKGTERDIRPPEVAVKALFRGLWRFSSSLPLALLGSSCCLISLCFNPATTKQGTGGGLQ